MASALNGLGASGLVGEFENAIGILLANVPLVRKIFLQYSVSMSQNSALAELRGTTGMVGSLQL